MITAADVFIDRKRFWVRLPSGRRRPLELADPIRRFHRLGQEDAEKHQPTIITSTNRVAVSTKSKT